MGTGYCSGLLFLVYTQPHLGIPYPPVTPTPLYNLRVCIPTPRKGWYQAYPTHWKGPGTRDNLGKGPGTRDILLNWKGRDRHL